MKPISFLEYIEIDYYSSTPKYLQLANSIAKAVRDGRLSKNDTLPSINELNYNFEISRDTAEKAYKHLKSIGILGSVPGKGYFVKSVETVQRFKVFLLFNKLSTHKKIIYDAIVAGLDQQAAIDFYIYDNNFLLFKKLIENANDDYSHYVIISHFLDGGDEGLQDVINKIPKDKLILLDKMVKGIDGEYAAIYENFEKDIFNALEQALKPLSKYHTIKITFPEHTYHSTEILKGFYNFCTQYAFNYKVVKNIPNEPINTGECYITLMENDVVVLIERLLQTDFKIGQDVGIISYNETPVKKIILNGLTTISTDFQKMGESVAQMIINNHREHIENPFYLTLRPSL
ncbi:GntR family transcriptional regulator [Mucilaginibacter terrae]|uniref:DNA-binding transcriptional regulator YhcF (GntR family) n=1 Tax=Mucilaginibacter terrae TaxID=1955052 RepID=A0ABU3GT12_9SPHI|nr:GntR family transcriptional regulator [Mucilaginibacter terrae]MDT3402775.1 DNA-binding transcriptional regulator YhcF (GntR family) [Mucilaginibacter terrae]